MIQNDYYEKLKSLFKSIAQKNQLLDEIFILKSATLSVEQAIGNPDRKDFPLMKGKEKLLQTEFRGYKGQAYTDMPGNWSATLNEIIHTPLDTNFDRAMLIASMNAVCSSLNLCSNSVHCKDNQPEECANQYLDYIKKNYHYCSNVGLIGLQPSLLQMLSENYNVRAVDLDPSNIGNKKFGVIIEDSEKQIEDLINWADLLLCTGSTVINGSLINILNLTNNASKPIIFFGTSIAATASLMNLERFCPKSL